jgi:hypothetical protein
MGLALHSGVMMPFFAEGNDVLFLAGKGWVQDYVRDLLGMGVPDRKRTFTATAMSATTSTRTTTCTTSASTRAAILVSRECGWHRRTRAIDTLVPRDAERGMGFLPRRALDVSQNEIARAFKIAGSTIEPLSFVVPRKVCVG